MPIRRLDKTLTATTATVAGEDIAANSIPVKPHIQPGILQPAIAGKDLSGTALGGSYTYGTAHTDGHSYYYTDIKGSKPIKDPRIGSHFGSQRYITSSMQLLEQETATNGTNVYSIDGREWFRASTSTSGIYSINSSRGQGLGFSDKATDSSFIEIVGYFNDANISMNTDTSHDVLRVTLNGGTLQSTDFAAAMETPLIGRYVRSGSSINLTFNSTPTLGINTVKISNTTGKEVIFYNVELIAQDTSSTANKSKIQIPSQNVVSYGKKFSIPATAQHYDPFNGFTNGTTLHSAVVDTATSLGLSTAPGSSASWAISSTNNIRPYNGGRVVKWVASDGTIKTSVNMMPPNAQNIGTTASAEITTPSATNTAYLPAFSDDAVDHSLAEVAKTFHHHEFGNGSANGHASYKDVSTMIPMTDSQTLVFTMDDGLTSFSGQSPYTETSGGSTLIPYTTNDHYYITFIGTGISLQVGASTYGTGVYNIAQNLPYGTHILKVNRPTGGSAEYTIDGTSTITVSNNTYGGFTEVTFHQPKKPPVPEDAVVLADYMLMADFVGIPSGTAGIQYISKGVRAVSTTRDVFYNESDGHAFGLSATQVDGSYFGSMVSMNGDTDNATSIQTRLPAFGTNYAVRGYDFETRLALYVDDVDKDSASTKHDGNDYGSHGRLTTNLDLGLYVFGCNGAVGGSHASFGAYEIASPIHTSSHYQNFETPYLHELVGGDRNMEQTNLVVTPDGKSWDEVTRDTSYIGSNCVHTSTDTATSTSGGISIMDEWRGVHAVQKEWYCKDFAIAYDRIIALRSGWYFSHATNLSLDSVAASKGASLHKNGTTILFGHSTNAGNHINYHHAGTFQVKRGDYLQIQGLWHSTKDYGHWSIYRIDGPNDKPKGF